MMVSILKSTCTAKRFKGDTNRKLIVRFSSNMQVTPSSHHQQARGKGNSAEGNSKGSAKLPHLLKSLLAAGLALSQVVLSVVLVAVGLQVHILLGAPLAVVHAIHNASELPAAIPQSLI